MVQNVWLPSMDHSSFIRLKTTGLSTLGVMLISAMPDEPVFVYLGLRCTVTLVRPSCVCLQTVKSLSCPLHAPAYVHDLPVCLMPVRPNRLREVQVYTCTKA